MCLVPTLYLGETQCSLHLEQSGSVYMTKFIGEVCMGIGRLVMGEGAIKVCVEIFLTYTHF